MPPAKVPAFVPLEKGASWVLGSRSEVGQLSSLVRVICHTPQNACSKAPSRGPQRNCWWGPWLGLRPLLSWDHTVRAQQHGLEPSQLVPLGLRKMSYAPHKGGHLTEVTLSYSLNRHNAQSIFSQASPPPAFTCWKAYLRLAHSDLWGGFEMHSIVLLAIGMMRV